MERQDVDSLLEKGHKKMERLTIPDEKIDGGMKRTCVDSREVKKCHDIILGAEKI